MNAAVEQERKKRAPYRTRRWWTTFDREMDAKFPIGSVAKVHRGKAYVSVTVLTRCTRGRIEVLNPVTGAQYKANVESMIPPSTRSVPQMTESLAAERAQRAQEHANDRSRPSVVSLYLRPLADLDKRTEEGREERDRIRLLPLSSDELVSYSALTAICKTLNTLHLNQDSFRNPELFSLIDSARILLQVCVRELESYTTLPEDA